MKNPEKKVVFRILCPEPENYSNRGIATAARLAQLETVTLSREEFEARAPCYDAFMVRLRTRVTGEIIAACPRLKAIITPTTGLDHIDLQAAQNCSIEVFSLKGEIKFMSTITSTAEHAWTLLLCLVRKIVPAQQSVSLNHWDQQPFRSFELAGKTLGVLGLGRLGTMVARYGLSFGMRVLAYDPHLRSCAHGVRLTSSLDEMLRNSNALTVHVPLNEKTVALIGERELRLLPPGAYVVNTSRGLIVKEPALLAALESGHLAGAAVDVLSDETSVPSGNHPMVAYAKTHNNLLITPHIGGASQDAIEKTDLFVINKFEQWLRRDNSLKQ